MVMSLVDILVHGHVWRHRDYVDDQAGHHPRGLQEESDISPFAAFYGGSLGVRALAVIEVSHE